MGALTHQWDAAGKHVQDLWTLSNPGPVLPHELFLTWKISPHTLQNSPTNLLHKHPLLSQHKLWLKILVHPRLDDCSILVIFIGIIHRHKINWIFYHLHLADWFPRSKEHAVRKGSQLEDNVAAVVTSGQFSSQWRVSDASADGSSHLKTIVLKWACLIGWYRIRAPIWKPLHWNEHLNRLIFATLVREHVKIAENTTVSTAN